MKGIHRVSEANPAPLKQIQVTIWTDHQSTAGPYRGTTTLHLKPMQALEEHGNPTQKIPSWDLNQGIQAIVPTNVQPYITVIHLSTYKSMDYCLTLIP